MEWIKNNYRVVIAVAGSIVLGLLILFTVSQIQSCISDRDIKKSHEEIEKIKAEKEVIDAELDILRQQKAVIDAEVAAKEEEHKRLQDAVDQAQQDTNSALDNVNTINNTDFNGTSANNAQSIRCRAYPDSPECQ